MQLLTNSKISLEDMQNTIIATLFTYSRFMNLWNLKTISVLFLYLLFEIISKSLIWPNQLKLVSLIKTHAHTIFLVR